MESKNVNTGHKDAKGRIIYKGPRGGEFVRGAAGKKLPPAMGGFPRRSESPVRRPKSPVRQVNLPGDIMRKIYNTVNTETKSRMQLATKRKNVFPTNSPLFAKIAKSVYDARKKADAADGSIKDPRGKWPVATAVEKLDAKCTMVFDVYKNKKGLLQEDFYMTLTGEPGQNSLGHPPTFRYGVRYNRSNVGNKINRVNTYVNTGSDRWERQSSDVVYILEYIKRSVAAKKLPFA